MKRLIPLLTLLAFLLTDDRLVRPQVTFQWRVCGQDCVNLSACLPTDTIVDKWDGGDQPSVLPIKFGSPLAPAPKELRTGNRLSLASHKHYYWLGLGSGALPS